MSQRRVIEDAPGQKILCLGYEDERELNGQTAYNGELVAGSERCGCFHCGSSFPGRQVSEWLAEDGGVDTALCPYCGTDAVIVGTERLPLSTALLASLYMRWYKEEHEILKAKATRMPRFSGREDYMRKGIPFLMEIDEEAEIVGEISLFPKRVLDVFGGDGPGGVVRVEASFDDTGCYEVEFIGEDGVQLPYEPWGGREYELLPDLTKRYGDQLMGIVKEYGAGQMSLFVPKIAERERGEDDGKSR